MSGVAFWLSGVCFASYVGYLSRGDRVIACASAAMGFLMLIVGFATN